MPLSVLVVGAGPAGVSAAMQLRRLGADVRWWDRDGAVGGLLRNAWRVENWPGVPVGEAGSACCERLREHAKAFGLEPEPVEATGCVETSEFVEISSGGVRERFDAVVWAVGTAPLAWELAFPDLPVVYEYAMLPVRARRVLIVGGGEAACDGALRAAVEGRIPTLVVRSDRLRARGRLAELTLAHPMVDRRFSTEVVALALADPGVIATLRKADSQDGASGSTRLEVDAVLFCGGRGSRLPALGLSLPPSGALRLTPHQWVIGDARLGGLGQVCIALGDGLLAAMEIIRWD